MIHESSEPQAMNFMQELHPDEMHNAGGDCNNPKCNYQWTPQDQAQVSQYGVLTCPQCQHTFDYKSDEGNYTNAGLTLRQMGQLGEAVVARIGNIPKVGQIQQLMEDDGQGYNAKIDMIAGNAEPFWGVEVKTNHAQPLDAKVLTPSGWALMGNLQVGDVVIDAAGGHAKIAAISPRQERQMYRIMLSDGSSTECDIEHLWNVRGPYRTRGWKTQTLGQLQQRLNDGERLYVPMVEPVEFEEGHLPLDPYLLGLMIGDGNYTHNQTYFCTADEELIEEVSDRLPIGVAIKHRKEYLYAITTGKTGTTNPVSRMLRELGMKGRRAWEKTIPDAYKFASIESRMALLRGLMDTDGTAGKGVVIFYTTSPQLALDVQFVTQSLGGHTTIRQIDQHLKKQNQKTFASKRPLYALSIGLLTNPFNLRRKAEQWSRTKGPSRKIISITSTVVKTCQCILLDSESHLYVTDDFIVTHNSQAQQRFKISGKRENRLAKLKYCMENGLKPGLLGVRLNFYTDQADLFWRPGLTDTWIGNAQMDHLGTYDFSDLNPFPDPNSVPVLPDQSEEPDDDLAFLDPISAKLADFDPNNHPRDQLGKFTVRKGQSEVKVVDKKGKHLHTVKWCKHCGEGYRHPAEHKGRIECPTCGEDPERKLRSSAYVVYGKDEADQVAAQLGWTQAGTFDNGHRRYVWMDDKGVQHRIGVGSGKHDKNSAYMDGYFARQRMQTCMGGNCIHMSGTEQQMLPQNVHPERQPLRPGDQVESLQGKVGVIADIEQGLVLVQYEDRTEDILHEDEAKQQLKAVASTPDWAFAFYRGALEVTEWDHNLHFRTLAEKLLSRFGMSVDDTDWQASFDGWTAGFLYDHGKGELSFDFKHPADPDIQTQAIVAVHSWIDGHSTSKPADTGE